MEKYIKQHLKKLLKLQTFDFWKSVLHTHA